VFHVEQLTYTKFTLKAKVLTAHAYTEAVRWDIPGCVLYAEDMLDARTQVRERCKETWGSNVRVVFIELVEEVIERYEDGSWKVIHRSVD
jgi:hypothetical protein